MLSVTTFFLHCSKGLQNISKEENVINGEEIKKENIKCSFSQIWLCIENTKESTHKLLGLIIDFNKFAVYTMYKTKL